MDMITPRSGVKTIPWWIGLILRFKKIQEQKDYVKGICVEYKTFRGMIFIMNLRPIPKLARGVSHP